LAQLFFLSPGGEMLCASIASYHALTTLSNDCSINLFTSSESETRAEECASGAIIRTNHSPQGKSFIWLFWVEALFPGRYVLQRRHQQNKRREKLKLARGEQLHGIVDNSPWRIPMRFGGTATRARPSLGLPAAGRNQ
jgi:hypothetical protein